MFKESKKKQQNASIESTKGYCKSFLNVMFYLLTIGFEACMACTKFLIALSCFPPNAKN
jgi:hypothetical protein